MRKDAWRWWAVGAWLLLMVQQLPRIPREKHFYESLQYYATQPLEEYPTAATWPLRLLGGHIEGGFVALLVLIEALILAACIAAGSRKATWLWVALVAAAGPLMLSRMDLIPAALVGATAALMVRMPWLAGAALATAAAMKLWPGVVAAALLGSWRRITGFVTTFTALIATSVLIHGLQRTLSPLTYQQQRGVQVESLFGAPLLLTPGATVDYAASRSYEVFGPGVTTAAHIADWAQILILAAALTLGIITARRTTHEAHLACATTIVLLIIATNKVFSPQYVVWMLPLMLVVTHHAHHTLGQVVAWLSIPTMVLTSVVYPTVYDGILLQETGPVLVLLARNGLIIITCVLAAGWWAQSLKPKTPPHAPTGQCPQPS